MFFSTIFVALWICIKMFSSLAELELSICFDHLSTATLFQRSKTDLFEQKMLKTFFHLLSILISLWERIFFRLFENMKLKRKGNAHKNIANLLYRKWTTEFFTLCTYQISEFPTIICLPIGNPGNIKLLCLPYAEWIVYVYN